MNPKESISIRLEMAEMHSSVLDRIEDSYKNKQYIEVCWLCYACFESRVNRVLIKICSGCNKDARKTNRKIGITTKLECFVRLVRSDYPPLLKENIDFIHNVKGWCKERNDLIHGMVSLEYYNDADKKFENLAKRGKTLVKKMYSLGTDVREYYYQTTEIPKFNQKVMDSCPLKYKCIKEAEG